MAGDSSRLNSFGGAGAIYAGIYASFADKKISIPAIPWPLRSRDFKRLVHKNKERKCLCKRGSSLYLSEKVRLNLLTQSALNRQSPSPHM